jgi:radical SAM protein with 4Fe4S-binding SPASM domain
MDWEPIISDLYKKIVRDIPWGFRAMVKPMLKEAAEKKSLQRNASRVTEADLITALFDITPGPFQAEARQNLQAMGIDVDRYIRLQEIDRQYRVSWESFGKAFHPGNIHFAMYVTDRCNQHCLHCAASSPLHRPELSSRQWFSIIDNLESSLQKEGRHGVYIWFGGEPTLRDDIRDLIHYCGQKGYFQAIITNGVLFDDSFAQFCAQNHMSHVFVSFDSADPDKNDRVRGAAGSLAAAKQAVTSARKHGLFVCASTTVTRHNIDELEDIKSLAQEWGAMPYFRAVVKQKKAAANWQEIGLRQEDYRRLYDFKYQEAVEAIRNGKAGTLPIYSIYEMVPFMEEPQNDAEMTALEWGVGCQACRTMAGVDVNGDIFPCGYPSDLTLGNGLIDSFTDIMASQLFRDIRDRKRTGQCATCTHLKLCGGGCRVHAESETGDFFAPFPQCWHTTNPPHH